MRNSPRLWAGLVVLFWIAVVGGLAGPVTGRLAEVATNDNASFLPDSAESTRAIALEAGFGDADVLPTVVVYERASGITAADLAAVNADARKIEALDGLRGKVSPPVPSPDGQAVQLFVPVDGADFDRAPAVIDAIRGAVSPANELDAYVTGVGGITADLFEVFGAIDGVLVFATAGVVILILLVVYRSPVLWMVPLFSVALAFTLAAGLIYALAKGGVLALNGQSQGILTVLVFGAGTDYALLLIARYREELHEFDRPWDAMKVALRGAVPAILASGATVILGLLCLLASELNSTRSLGPVSALGILGALAAMTTLLPAVLVLAGRRIFWPRIPRPDHEVEREHGVWSKVSAGVGRRPQRYAVVTLVLLGVLGVYATQLRADGLGQQDSFTKQVESVTGAEVIAAHYPAGSGLPLKIFTDVALLEPVRAIVAGDRDVAEVTPLTAPGGTAPVVSDGKVLLSATLAVAGDGARAQAVVRRLRTEIDAADPQALVGGFTAVNLDVQDASKRDNVVIIPLVLLVILLVLGGLLRSVVASLMLVATVVLSFLATLGVCAFFFNEVFGFAGADPAFPLFAFVFLVALGIDYNIFLMTRVREETVRRGTREGVLKGLAVTGGVITSAGVVLAATFGVLGVLPLVFLAELGFAVAFGVLLDTLIVRSLLVPSLTLLLGDRIWWPSPLRHGSGPQQGRVDAVPLEVVDAPR